MSAPPLVSVIVPAYNASRFIERALASVQGQTYPNLEVLVVDDGSDDNTAEIVEAIAACDSRVELLRQSNRGVAAARNRAIAEARGTYVAPLDADDVWFPRKLEWQVQRMRETGPSTGFVYSWWAGLDETGEIVGAAGRPKLEGRVYEALIHRNFIGNASVPLFRRSCVERVGGYNTTLKARGGQGCEDWDLTLRIAEKYDVHLVPAYLSGYRAVTDSMSESTSSMARSFDLIMEAIERKHPEIPSELFQWSRANFSRYLAAQSYSTGNFEKTLDWLRKVLRRDPAAILSSWVVKTALKSAVRHLASPATSLIWETHQEWINFKRTILWDRSDSLSIARLQHRPESVTESWTPRWWKPHDQIRAHRWRCSKQRCASRSEHRVEASPSWLRRPVEPEPSPT